MQERHQNRNRYFEEQGITTEKYVLPFIQRVKNVEAGSKILEVGCGEGGNLMPFLNLGCHCYGIDIACNKISNGNTFYKEHPGFDKLSLMCEDVFKWQPAVKFDVIFLRDVLEHLPDRAVFLNKIKTFLNPGGVVFLGFPPWQNPFGGHQQICENKWLSKAVFMHLLPRRMYHSVLKKGGESGSKIESLMEIRDTRISIGQFLRLIKRCDYKINKQMLYFINPNYEIKFGLKPRKQILSFIPVLRNFIITTCYYVISPK